jgi:ribosome-associated translation inhibitor RaiA
MMNLDIQTEHALMRPEWHRMIDEWVERCVRQRAGLTGLELTLRHGPGEEVDIVATAHGRTVRASRQGELMSVALRDALDVLEYELLAREAGERRP